MIDTKFLVDNIHLIITAGGVIITPIGIAIKIKLDKMTNLNDKYFPSVEKYEKQFKQHKSIITEQVKKPNTNKKGW